MIIAKMCQECVGVVTGHCAGKKQSETKPGRKPCREYVFDMSMASETDIEPDSPPPSLKRKQAIKPLIPGSVLVVNKTKAANFERLAVKRLSVLLDGFRKLSNLGNKATYEWTDEQCDAIVGRLRSAVDDLEKKFQK